MSRRCVRFDVTPYADMHLGHVWPAWRAYQLSRRLGVDFMLQFDDDAYVRRNLWHQSWSLATSMQRFAEDFCWLGIPPDRVAQISEHNEAACVACEALGIGEPRIDTSRGEVATPLRGSDPLLEMPDKNMGVDWQLGACHEWSEVLHVVADHANGVARLVRGMDLHYRSGLYAWLWHRLYGGEPPAQHYERLVTRDGAKVSKSTGGGGTTIRDLRDAGYTAHEIVGTIRELAWQTAEAGLRDIALPEGVLELGEVRQSLTFDEMRWLREELARQEAQAGPWTPEIRLAFERLGAAPECCTYCGGPVAAQDAFCAHCGASR